MTRRCTYHRGYALVRATVGTEIWFRGELISIEATIREAKRRIDDWLWAV